MPRRTITSAQNKALDTGFLDLMGSESNTRNVVKFETLVTSLEYLGQLYTKKLTDQLIKKDADSSGKLSDSIIATEVQLLGSTYSVSISTLKYASFLDEGVDGWAKSRGSRFKFKTKGVDPKGDHVKSVKAWLVREANIARIKNRAVSNRERKRASIKDASTQAAISAAYMIKRQGIKPTHFWRDATKEMEKLVAKEFAAAFKIDIIKNITK